MPPSHAKRALHARAIAILAAPFMTLWAAGCGGAEPVEEAAEQQESIGPLPVDDLGRPLNPVTLEPIDPYPLGYCTYVCSLARRWVAITSSCKSGGVCDDLSGECTQEWDTIPIVGGVRPRERRSSCVYPDLFPELSGPTR